MAEMREIGDVKVNDGGGLLDTDGMIDNTIIACNQAIKDLIDGQYINFCARINNISQMLVALKSGVKSELEAAKAKVEEMKRINNELVEKQTGLEVGE